MLPWNEVNMYVGPGDGGTDIALIRNLVGIFVRQRNWWDDNKYDLGNALKRLGVYVPTFEIAIDGDAPDDSSLDWFNPGQPTTLVGAPHNIKQIA